MGKHKITLTLLLPFLGVGKGFYLHLVELSKFDFAHFKNIVN